MNNSDEYLETRVMTATPHQLHLMVIDGAIRFAAQAEQALEKKDFEVSHLALNRSREFVTELIGGLNEEPAEELVKNLKKMFMFVYKNLVDADLNRDPQLVTDALKILRMHRETWVEVGVKLKEEPPPAVEEEPGPRAWAS